MQILAGEERVVPGTLHFQQVPPHTAVQQTTLWEARGEQSSFQLLILFVLKLANTDGLSLHSVSQILSAKILK